MVGEFFGLDGGWNGGDFVFDFGGEGGVEFVFVIDVGEFGVGFEGFVEVFGDNVFEFVMALVLFVEFDDDFVVGGGDWFYVV